MSRKTFNKPPEEKVKEIPHHSNNVMFTLYHKLWRRPEEEEDAFTKISHFSSYSISLIMWFLTSSGTAWSDI